MKKVFSIALSLLMLISCFALSVSAEGVNVAAAEKGATYVYDTEVAYLGANTDDTLTILNDGVVPEAEIAGEAVAFTGTGVTVMITFDLGAVYSDITDVNFLCVCDSYGDGKSNRGFSGENTKFSFSADGVDFTRNKDFTMEKVDRDDTDTTSFYNFCFKFDAPVTAQYLKITMNNSGGYVLSLGEIEVISTSGEGSAPVAPESSEEIVDDSVAEGESTDESVAEGESTDESVAEGESVDEGESTDASADASAEASADESAAASTEESKEASKAPTSSSTDKTDDEGGINPVVIIIIIVAVIAVAAVVVVVMKKRK